MAAYDGSHSATSDPSDVLFTKVMSAPLSIFLLCVVAAFIQRSIGFGFGIFIMTMLPYLMPSYGEATTFSGIMALLSSIAIAWKSRHITPWRKMWVVLIAFFIVSWFFVAIVSTAPSAILKKILGAMLVIAVIWFAFISKHITVRPTIGTQLTVGALSGVMGGLFGMQGPPVILYFLSCTSSNKSYMALAQTYFVIGNLIMTVFRATHGMLTPTVGISCLYGLPGIIIGAYLGMKASSHISHSLLRTIVNIYIALSGIVALITS
ncbi:MAG: sulfite exporter TauE/SafE family protein [Bacteroidales bacterium]|nr:sulfite exporter TauE/SafE family protein [Candidatus Colimorpha onthohippi]